MQLNRQTVISCFTNEQMVVNNIYIQLTSENTHYYYYYVKDHKWQPCLGSLCFGLVVIAVYSVDSHGHCLGTMIKLVYKVSNNVLIKVTLSCQRQCRGTVLN